MGKAGAIGFDTLNPAAQPKCQKCVIVEKGLSSATRVPRDAARSPNHTVSPFMASHNHYVRRENEQK